jgi:hypothetical protein
VHEAPQAVTSVALAQAPLHGLKPLAQVKAHWPALQTGLPPSGATHVWQAVPQAVVDVSGTQRPWQRLKPAEQESPHWPEAQVAMPLLVPGQGTHSAPQELGESSGRQRLPQRWKPALQAKSHERTVTPASVVLATQVGLPLAGAGHTVQRSPHVWGAALSAQASPHR